MANVQPQFRRTISEKQLALLHVLYRFRFATTDLVTKYQGRGPGSVSVIYKSLQRLVEQGYVGCHYEPGYHIRHKRATYYLLAKGVTALKKRPGFTYSPKAMYNTRWDKTASEQFVTRNLSLLEIYCALKAQYGDKLQFFTKSDLAAYPPENFPKPLPDAYMRLETDAGTKQYFVNLHYQLQPIETARCIKQYLDHAATKERQGAQALPKLLTVCDTPALQKILQRRMARVHYKQPLLDFLTTTKDAITGIAKDTAIWRPTDTTHSAVALETAS